MDEKFLLQRLTSIYQLLDQVRCAGHQNHTYLTASMDSILDLIQGVKSYSASTEESQMRAGE